jgi:hypothetical protein
MNRIMLISLVGLLGAVLFLVIKINAKNEEISDFKHQIRRLKYENELILQTERKRLLKAAYNEAKKYYDNLPTKTEIQIKYKTKYEKITDSIIVLPDSVKFEFIRSELERLYGPDYKID